MKALPVLFPALFLWGAHCLAQQSPPAPLGIVEHSPEELIALDVVNNYTLAYNLNNAAKVMALYADNLQYQALSGGLLEGKASLQPRLEAFFLQHKGATIDIGLDYVKQLTTNVITERGRTTVTVPGGGTESTLFNLALVKNGDEWLIAQVTEESAAIIDTSEQTLAALDWLIGDWKEQSGDTTVLSKIVKATGDKFLNRTYTVSVKGEEKFHGTEIIGWDPRSKSIHSWFFDQEGGFGEGTWSHEGDAWLIKTTSILPDGRPATASHTWRRKSQDQLSWSSADRSVDGISLPSIESIQVDRVK